ncbi:lysylphosphatidylglycerol synthase transmembrane domain-containing protein [Knoellia sp. Soil729]|uniref:lysylphosphatidylglycerol synthase transmembrane domain-containing protein n=1 Tax=Knoellia sp. Soil729 TaxID=1736394 RepID=UPI0006FA60E0|nr:lysylphosphatidylglycerol synthase transmembrane domain-containing protein [Knoellia sp. Soil729]KRE42157.1 hypothetical protein ASG74_06765 [Knoellia sp. Soil729]
MDAHPVPATTASWSVPVRAAATLALAALVLWWALPRVTGVDWSAIGGVVAGITPRAALLLAVLWMAGLFTHSFVLTAALPGLSCRRALTLNLTGSAVSNVVPFGGALGLALNLSMIRSWRFHRSSYATFVVVTNIWDVLAKLALPVVALAVMVARGALPTPALRSGAEAGAVLLALFMAVVVAVVWSDPLAHAAARLLVSVARRFRRRPGTTNAGLEEHLLAARSRVRQVVAHGWAQLTIGMVGYVACQGALLWFCLRAVGQTQPVYAVLAALAADRLLSLVPLTPGGAGFAEVGAAATLIACGAQPLAVTAGVLLYRAFIFLLEIPVGGLWLGCWWALRSRAGLAAEVVAP